MRLGIASRYKRWRHGRGFGVHSPFAYDFITRTLRERLPYYAYHNLDVLAAEQSLSRAERKSLRLLFRIAVRVNAPSAAVVGGGKTVAMQKMALRLVRRDINLSAPVGTATLVIVNEDVAALPAGLSKAVWLFPDTNRGGRASCEALWESCRHAMRFDNSRGFTIIVISDKFPRQRFDVRF